MGSVNYFSDHEFDWGVEVIAAHRIVYEASVDLVQGNGDCIFGILLKDQLAKAEIFD